MPSNTLEQITNRYSGITAARILVVLMQPAGHAGWNIINTSTKMSNAKTNGILGLLAGVAVGATLGILFAPASGKKTRARIRERMNHAKDDLADSIDRAHEEWSKAKGKAADMTSMTKDEVSDFVRFLFEEGKDLKARLGRDVEDAAENVASKARKTSDNVRHSAN